MTQDEIRELKAEQSKMYRKMTPEEITEHANKVTQAHFDYVGRDRVVATDQPNVWRIKAKKI